MRNQFHVRFATPTYQLTASCQTTMTQTSGAEVNTRRQTKSKGGCLECKRLRVKRDEAYPVCHHCQRRSALFVNADLVEAAGGRTLARLRALHKSLYGISSANNRPFTTMDGEEPSDDGDRPQSQPCSCTLWPNFFMNHHLLSMLFRVPAQATRTILLAAAPSLA